MKVRNEQRMVIGSPFYQGEDEEISREILVPTSWGAFPFTALSTTVKEFDSDTQTFSDVTSTKASGSTTSTDNKIRTPLIKLLEESKIYIVEVKFTSASLTKLEFWFELRGEE